MLNGYATHGHEPCKACSLPQYTHHLLHTPGIVEVRNSRRQAADKSYIFYVSLGGSGEVYAGMCVCVCAFFRHLNVCMSVPVYIDVCVCLPTVIPVPQTKEPIGSCGKTRT